MAEQKYFAVKMKHSAIGCPEKQKRTMKSLGLTRFGKTSVVKDSPAMRGMIYKVIHLLDVQQVDAPKA